MSERRRSAILGMVFGYTSLLVALARNMAFVPLYLHRIPLAEYGAWLATGGALALILINDYGLSGVVTQRISTRFGAGKLKSLGALVGSALAIGALLALLLTGISFACVPFLPGLQTLSETEAKTVVSCFQIAIAANALGIMGTTAISVLRSLQLAVLSGSIALAADLANVAITLFGLFAGHGLYAIAVGILVRSAILAVASICGVWFVCLHGLNSKLVVAGNDVLNLLAESSHFFLSSIAMKLQAQANVFFVALVLGPVSAGIYSLTVRAHETVLLLVAQINGALVPSITHLFGSGEVARFRSVILRVLVSIGALTAFALTMAVILDFGFLRLWVGQYAFGGQYLSVLMAIALFVSAIGYVAYDALLAQGRFRLVSSLFVATSVLQVVLLASQIHRGLWFAPMSGLITACVWGSAFWRHLAIEQKINRAEIVGLFMDFARIAGVSAVVATGFVLFYPAPRSWIALATEGLLSVGCLACGYLISSRTIRNIALEEAGLTMRLFRAA
jgi:O-antigen/teichoic acid export membrane protein